jgi:hypothetical protein
MIVPLHSPAGMNLNLSARKRITDNVRDPPAVARDLSKPWSPGVRRLSGVTHDQGNRLWCKPVVKLLRYHVEGQQLVFPGIPVLDFQC